MIRAAAILLCSVLFLSNLGGTSLCFAADGIALNSHADSSDCGDCAAHSEVHDCDSCLDLDLPDLEEWLATQRTTSDEHTAPALFTAICASCQITQKPPAQLYSPLAFAPRGPPDYPGTLSQLKTIVLIL